MTQSNLEWAISQRLTDEPQQVIDLVPEGYAKNSTQSALRRMERYGEAVRTDEGWRAP